MAVILAGMTPMPGTSAPQDLEVLEFVVDHDVRAHAMECYTTSTGVIIKTVDSCPNRKVVEREIKALLKRLGASKDHLLGHDVSFTNHRMLARMGYGWVYVNGVTWFRTPGLFLPWSSWSAVSTHPKNGMGTIDVLVHELGHAAFEKIGIDTDFLDVDKDSVEKTAVMDRTKRLPKDHPARVKFKAMR